MSFSASSRVCVQMPLVSPCSYNIDTGDLLPAGLRSAVPELRSHEKPKRSQLLAIELNFHRGKAAKLAEEHCPTRVAGRSAPGGRGVAEILPELGGL